VTGLRAQNGIIEVVVVGVEVEVDADGDLLDPVLVN